MKKKIKTNKKKKNNKLTVDENEFLNVVDIIAKKLAYKFKFGYHDFDDMKQQISIFALEGLKNYDHKRPLENFLWTHVRNRLFNYKRDNYQRPDKPCLSCPLYDPNKKYNISGCKEYNNKNDCELYANWSSRNSNKKNLMHLTTIDEIKNYASIFYDNNKDILEKISNIEIFELLDSKLIGEERIIYLKIKDGIKINKQDSTKLINKIKDILKESFPDG